RGAEIVDDYLGTMGRKHARVLAANASSRAGDHRHAPFAQPAHRASRIRSLGLSDCPTSPVVHATNLTRGALAGPPGLPLVFIRAKQAPATRVRAHNRKNGRNEMKRRDVLKAAGAGFAAAAIAKPAIAQSMPELKWRCTSSFPKSLDTLYG